MRLRTLIAGALAIAGASSTLALAETGAPSPARQRPIVLADVNNVISEIGEARLKTKDGKTDKAKAKTTPNAIPKKNIPQQDSSQKH